jgi:hypothetical protein
MRLLAQPTWRILLVVVGVSAAVRAWAGDTLPTPWIAPDELIYADLGRSFWHSGHFELWGHPVALFSAVYPVFAGLPLSLHDRVAGYELLKGLQAVVMSLTAIPVYFWGRELVSRGWALVAATLSLAVPSLAYSGLIMTEVAFYPVFVLAAWALARAIALPTPRRQVLALAGVVLVCATRLQALLFLPAYVTAVALDALAARDARRLRAHVPAGIALVVLALAWSAWQLRHGGPVTKVLGAYQAAGEAGYSFGPAVRFVLYHFGDVVFICGVVPFCALVVLAVRTFAGGDDPRVRALVVTTLSLIVWMCVEVGVFASRAIGHLAERNLFPLVPLLVLALVVWLARGAPRPVVAGLAAAVLALALLVAVPFETMSSLAATPSAFSQIPLYLVTSHVNLDVVVPLAAAVLLTACALAPVRWLALGLPLVLLVLGVVASSSASRFITSQSKLVQYLTIGKDRMWIDHNTSGPTTWLYAGQTNWEGPWQARFWNRNLVEANGFLGTTIPGGLPSRSVGPGGDGKLVDDRSGVPIGGDYIATSSFFDVRGTDVAHPLHDVVLWRTDQPIRLKSWLQNVGFDGSVPSLKARFFVYDCNGGTVRASISAPAPTSLDVVYDGVKQRTLQLTPEPTEIALSVPTADGGVCLTDFVGTAPFVIQNVKFA